MLHPPRAACILSDRAHDHNMLYRNMLEHFKRELVVSVLHFGDIYDLTVF